MLLIHPSNSATQIYRYTHEDSDTSSNVGIASESSEDEYLQLRAFAIIPRNSARVSGASGQK